MPKRISQDVFSADYASNPGEDLGTLAENQYGDVFMFIKQVGATTAAIGELACRATSGTRGEVSRTAATSIVNTVDTLGVPAGVFQAALAVGHFGWIQVKGTGIVAIAVTDGNVVAGDPIMIDGAGTPVGAVKRMSAGKNAGVWGTALTDDSGTTMTAGTYVVHVS